MLFIEINIWGKYMKFKGEDTAGTILALVAAVCLLGMIVCMITIVLGENGLLSWYCPYTYCPEPNSAPYMGAD